MEKTREFQKNIYFCFIDYAKAFDCVHHNKLCKILKESESEVSQSCPTLCDPMDCSLSGSSVHGIFQARVLEWIDISYSRGSSDPGIEPGSPALQANALPSEPPGKPKHIFIHLYILLYVFFTFSEHYNILSQ